MQNIKTSPYKLTSLAIVLCLSLPVAAMDYESGKQAYLDGQYSLAFEILEPLAQTGRYEAQVLLADIYANGRGLPVNLAEALRWYTYAAKQGIPEAQHDLAIHLYSGKGTSSPNAKQAAYWWRQAADQGFALSQYQLGLLYYRGDDGIVQDHSQAVLWFTRAAELKDPDALYSLGVMHAFGQHFEQDYQRAYDLFKQSAELGNTKAMYNLSILYENGQGVDSDPQKAAQWRRRADASSLGVGDTPAQKSTAAMLGQKPHTPAQADSRQKTAAKVPAPDAPPNIKPMPADGQARFIQRRKNRNTRAADAVEVEKTPPTIATDAVQASAATLPNQLNRTQWLSQQDPNSYTLQLSSLSDEKAALRYLQQHNLGVQAGYVKVTVKRQPRHSVIYGIFLNRQQAVQAIATLPSSVRKNKPWIRQLRQLQELLH
ncbi:MAG: SPOR domain-containing protein [Candidatus Eutrophobiaceae bacterium]